MKSTKGQLATLRAQPSLLDRIKIAQQEDPELVKKKKQIQDGQQVDFKKYSDRSLRFRGRVCVPDDPSLKTKALREAHNSRFSVHPGA